MKKIVLSLALALILSCNVAQAAQSQAVGAGNPVELLTGKVWVETPESNKAAFLFGLETAIAVEHAVNTQMVERSAKTGKRPVSNVSPFEKGWMQAFKNVDRKDIVMMVDNWYAANPDKLPRPVMDVIWYELIEPRTVTAK